MSQQSGGLRLLHVEDDPAFGELTSTYLERVNSRFSVELATSAEEGLTRLATDEFDAIISDYDMPGMDGIEFLGSVREDYPEIPFVLFTGKGSEEVASEAIKEGVTDYLQKSPGGDRFELLANRVENAIERRRAERNFRRAQETYEQVAQLATDAFWTYDPELDEFTLSDGFERVFGHPGGVVENGFDWAVENIHPEDRDSVMGDVEKTLNGDPRESQNEYRFRRGDGTYAEVRSRRSTIKEGEGTRMVGVLIDVSIQNQHNRILEQYENVLESIPDAVWMVDREGVVQYLNDATAATLGLPKNTAVGHHFGEVLRKSDVREAPPELSEYLNQILNEGEDSVQMDLTLQRNGEVLERDLRLTPVQVQGEIWAIGISRDITERKRAENRFKSLFENLADPVVALTYTDSGEPEVTSVNESFERTFGYDSETVRGEPLDDFIVPAEFKDGAEELDCLVQSGEQVNRELIRKTSDGTLRNFQFHVVHTEKIDDEQVIYAVYRDITEEKQYAERLEQQNAKLDAFAGKVAHDLRNPLNVASGWLDDARTTGSTDSLDRICDALARMDVIIGDVLSLARSAGKVGAVEPVSLHSVIDVAWQMSGRSSASLTIDGELGEIEADESRLMTLFENLIRNAIEHGGSDVSIRVGRLAGGGFYFEDDGPGIPEMEWERVFESGYTTTETGTGFGLAIVNEIVAAHGWEVSLAEGAGGARFEITGVASTGS